MTGSMLLSSTVNSAAGERREAINSDQILIMRTYGGTVDGRLYPPWGALRIRALDDKDRPRSPTSSRSRAAIQELRRHPA